MLKKNRSYERKGEDASDRSTDLPTIPTKSM